MTTKINAQQIIILYQASEIWCPIISHSVLCRNQDHCGTDVPKELCRSLLVNGGSICFSLYASSLMMAPYQRSLDYMILLLRSLHWLRLRDHNMSYWSYRCLGDSILPDLVCFHSVKTCLYIVVNIYCARKEILAWMGRSLTAWCWYVCEWRAETNLLVVSTTTIRLRSSKFVTRMLGLPVPRHKFSLANEDSC